MSKTWKRKGGIVLIYLIFSLIHFSATNNSQIFFYAGGLAILTMVLESIFYSKRGVFLYALIGMVAGYFAGKFLYELLARISPGFFIQTMEPYFILMFAYLGLVLPLLSSAKVNYSINYPFNGEGEKKTGEIKLIDTSVIIDGRISDIAETGFISGTLILPKFVLNEIQALADSKDPIKRSRARRGLDVLNKLKEMQSLDLKIFSRDYPEIKGVDAKLISLAKEMSASIITNDYNLNKVAKLDGILILNLNDLANALKPVLLPGEEMELDVLKEGKENNQGVGYLSDGTMVVVASGINYIGKRIHVKVTSILQTSAGRIIFTEPKK